MEGLDKGGQGPILGCCTIEEEEEVSEESAASIFKVEQYAFVFPNYCCQVISPCSMYIA
jgi:hypothetical protein